MEPKAEAVVLLKVHAQCEDCKLKMCKVFNSTCGVYDITIDAEKEITTIKAEVNPNALLRAISIPGNHAELIRVHFRDKRTRHYSNYDRYASSPPSYNQQYGYDNYGYGGTHNAIGDSWAPQGLPACSTSQYYDYRDPNCSAGYLPQAQYVPSNFPPAQYVPSNPVLVSEYDNMNSCTIM